MLALYRAGRQADSLEAYRHARALLVEQLGIEPGPRLRDLHEAVLRHDRTLDEPREAAAPTATMALEDGGALLERSPQLGTLAARLEAVLAHRRGQIVLIAGEAGIGKTALVRRFCSEHPSVRVLHGACDALYTPRPLGPLADIVEETGGELAAQLKVRAAPGAIVTALARDVREGRPVVIVLEDLHWADEATLDVVRLLARRIDALPALVLVTYRDDELGPEHPLRIVLGELLRRAAERMTLAPLSATAVAQLAGSMAIDHADLHRRTGGNPFFVSEVLAAGGDIPSTVRDAVLARAARLDPAASALLDAVAIVSLRTEMWLLEALAAGRVADLDVCLTSGMLRAERDAVSFRHEIARAAVEDALPPHRRLVLHRRALAALEAAPPRRHDPARLAHHAEAAGDVDAVLRHAPAAGEQAAKLGAHGEAAAQFARALRYAEEIPPARRAELLERASYEHYLTDRIADALDARRRALEEHRATADRLREGDAHRWLSRLAWCSGDSVTAEREARHAVDLLERLEPGRELAMAWSNIAQLRMLSSDLPDATAWGMRAIELAERLGETEIVVHALNTVGSAELLRGMPGGRAKLERSLELALDGGFEEQAARAYTNLGSAATEMRDFAVAERNLDAGIAYCREHDLENMLRHPDPAPASRPDAAVYDRIGSGYSRHRRPDPRLAAAIRAGLGDARTVVNVGAGAGAYEPTRPVRDRHRALTGDDRPAPARQRPSDPRHRRRAAAGRRHSRRRDGDAQPAPLARLARRRSRDAPRRPPPHRRVHLGQALRRLLADARVPGLARRLGRPAFSDHGGAARRAAQPDRDHGAHPLRLHRRVPRRLLRPARGLPRPDRPPSDVDLRAGAGPRPGRRLVGRARGRLRSGAWDARHGALRHTASIDAGYRLVATEL